jgi:tRNA(fMet)-specific endonuclease VapC
VKVLLDTDTCIHIIRQKRPDVLANFKTYDVGDIAVSSITVGELMYGALKGDAAEKNIRALEHFLQPLEVVSFDHLAAEVYGRVRLELTRFGKQIGALDMLIASQALQLGLTIITNNVREYSRIDGLTVENWAV